LPRLLRTRWLWLALLTACLPGASWAVAATGQPVVESVGSSVQGDTEIITIEFSEALVAAPSSFLIDSPARITIDVRGVSNGMRLRNFDLVGGCARTLRIASAPDRARLVIALNQPASYRTEVTGKTLTVFIKAAVAPAGITSAKTEKPGPRYLLLVEGLQAPIHLEPSSSADIVGRAEQGSELESDLRSGEWYRIRRVSGEPGWVRHVTTALGESFSVRTVAPGDRLSADGSGVPAGPIERARPQGAPIEPSVALIDPSRVGPPSALHHGESLPVRDRWRLVESLGLLPYDLLDPYNPNVLKGDLPVLENLLGKEWFFNLAVVSDTLLENRRLPTPSGAQSSLDPGTNGVLGRGHQTTLSQTVIVSLSLIKGDTTFRPPDYELRFVPVFNANRTQTQEVRAVNIDPSAGRNRNDSFVGVQELFIDKHLRDVSPRFDFDSLRIGIQPITADFRGFLFLDQAFGARLFGTRDNNHWQYNAGWFRRLEKDTNSGLNDISRRMRADDVFLLTAYRQDLLALGLTSEFTLLHNRNREGNRADRYNANGFLERPAVLGTGRGHNYDVTYLGYSTDGHLGKLNLSGSAYYATGHTDPGVISNRKERIGAYFGAIELSRDFDWVRLRASALHASGDKNPFDGKAGGFDAVLENPQFAGADTSYWIRQGVPLIGGGGVALSMRNGLLPSLRSSREFGQSNFTNPGLNLLGIGADLDLRPGLRLIGNVNDLHFDELASLEVLRNQRLRSSHIGVDVSLGLQYRPFFTQNVVFNLSAAALIPGRGLRELYGNSLDATQYSLLANLLLTY
jgi:hypothetical protein